MKPSWRSQISFLFVSFLVLAVALSVALPGPVRAQAENPAPPSEPVKLIFIHHSSGENWLSDGNGDLGRTLGENNYFVSDTNYGWGPDSIGDATDYPNWLDWFVGPESSRYLDALYNESGQLSSYTRPIGDPGGENRIIMFKSCFPNSALNGSPNDPPADGEWFTVGHAKYVYNQLLDYFVTRPDKLFIVITPPPLLDPSTAENARAFSRWLVEDWLDENGYPLNNVAVWDFHNVLTHPDNHHRWGGGAVEYTFNNGDGTLHYDSAGDEHPNQVGNQKSTAEFVPMLNIFYNRWIEEAPESPPPQQEEPTQSEAAEATPEPETGEPVADPPSVFVGSSLIDDFEADSPPGTTGWQSFWEQSNPDTTLSCGVDSSVAQSGSSSLRIDFHVEPGSWASCALFYDQNPGLGGTRGLSFDYRASDATLLFNIDAHGGSPDSRSTYHYTVETVPESVDDWVHMELIWDQIVRVEWEENPGSPVDPADINGFAFGFNTLPDTPNSGTVWIDNFSLLGAEEGQAPQSEAEATTEEEAAPQDEAEEPTAAPQAEEAQPQPESEESDRPSLCPGSMALIGIGVAFAGVVSVRKRRRDRTF